MTECDSTFPAGYELGTFSPESEKPDHTFLTEGVSRLAPALEVTVTTAGGREWSGEFFGGRDSLTKLVHGPAPDLLVAVAGGVGYIVPVNSPADYSVIPLRPVTEVRPVLAIGLLICVGLTALSAIGPDGKLRWISPRLVADGFAEVRIAASSIVARGWDAPAHREVEVTLDTRSGEIVARG